MRYAIRFLWVIGCLSVGMMIAGIVRAHEAITGWSYDLSCCSGMDCAVAPVGSVTATPGGWLIEIKPGDHPAAAFRAWSGVVPHNDPRIKPSGDADFHICIGLHSLDLLCLYTSHSGAGM